MKKNKTQKLMAALTIVSLLLGSHGTVFAAASPSEQDAYDAALVYDGSHAIVMTPQELNLFASGMMPGGESVQRLRLTNESADSTQVYVRVKSGSVSDSEQEELLKQLQMKITLHTKQDSELLVYDGNAAGVLVDGKTGNLTLPGSTGYGVLLGKLSPSGAADMTVTITAPTTLGNEYQDATAAVTWIFTCDADKPTPSSSSSSGGGGGGGGGSGGGGSIWTPVETIPESEVPLGTVESQVPTESGPEANMAMEEILDEEIPLIDSPGTGPRTGDDSNVVLWSVLFGLSGVCVLVLFRLKARRQK